MLEIDNIHVNYGRLQALRGVSITVAEGEVVCLVGPNGAGKSTTLAAIAGGVTPHAGSIRLQGRSLVGLPPEAITRLGVSLEPAGRHVFATLTVSENLLSLRRSDGLTLLINEQSSKRVLQFADRIYVLRGGRIQLHDRASNLQDGKAIMEAYFGFGEQPAPVTGSAALGGVAE